MVAAPLVSFFFNVSIYVFVSVCVDVVNYRVE